MKNLSNYNKADHINSFLYEKFKLNYHFRFITMLIKLSILEVVYYVNSLLS